MSYESLERRAWVVAVVVSAVTVTAIGVSSRGGLSGVAPDAPKWFLELIPHINAFLVLLGLTTVSLGYVAVRRGEVRRHAALMVTTAVVFFVFLALYFLRLTNLGLTEFPGTDFAYTYVYLPFLTVHMVLATVCVPLVLYSLIVGVTVPTDDIRQTSHPKVGSLAVPLWAISFAFGFVVYLMLYHLF